MKRLSFRYTALILLLWWLASVPAQGCVRSLATTQVTSDFRVMVRHNASGVAGIRVEIYDEADHTKNGADAEWKPILAMLTGRDGDVQVRDLPPGGYLVQTTGPGAGAAVYAQVSANHGQPSGEIALEWPYSWRGALKTGKLAGELASNNPSTPFENLHLELWTAGAETAVATAETGPTGRFHFNQTVPGIYILRIRGQQKGVRDDWQVEGDIPFELAGPEAGTPESVSLHLEMSDCGITYDACPIPKIVSTASRRIRVIGPEGDGIATAKYELVDQLGKVRTQGVIKFGTVHRQVVTKLDGTTDLPSDLEGRFTLKISSPGLTLLQQSLELKPFQKQAEEIFVTLRVHGGDEQCSAVSLETHATPQ